jgi:hypothetical protein
MPSCCGASVLSGVEELMPDTACRIRYGEQRSTWSGTRNTLPTDGLLEKLDKAVKDSYCLHSKR